MKIFVDFDNTLVDSVSAFVTRHNQLYSTRFNTDSILTYDFSNMNISEEEIIRGFDSRFFFSELELYSGAKDALIKLQNAGATLILLTRGTLTNIQLKIDWLNKHHWIKDLFSDFIFLTSNQDKVKVDMYNSILIDDYRLNHINSNAKYKYSFKDLDKRGWYPTNDDKVKVFNSWTQLADDICKILNPVKNVQEKQPTKKRTVKQTVENKNKNKNSTRNKSSINNKKVKKKNTKTKGGDK